MSAPTSTTYTKVRLDTGFGTFATTVTKQDTAKQLMDKMVRALGLKEVCYFGLMALTESGSQRMLTLGSKVLEQTGVTSGLLKVRLLVCFPPYDVEKLQQFVTQKCLFLGIHNMVLTGRYYCPPEHAFLMAAYAAHARYGSYSADVHPSNLLEKTKLLPDRVTNQLRLTHKEVMDKVSRLFQTLPKCSREEAMLIYLRIAQDLDQYGVRYCDVLNQDNVHLVFGICPFGLLVFRPDDRLTSFTAFHFGEISSISYRGKYVNINLSDGVINRTFTIETESLMTSKRMCITTIGLNEIYIRALDPDPDDQASLKAHAQKERDLRLSSNGVHSQGERAAAAEELRWQQNIQQRLTEFDNKHNQINSQLARLKSTCEQLNQKLKSAGEKMAASAQEYKQCLRQKDYYNQEIVLNAAMLATLTRSGVNVSKKTLNQQQEVYSAQVQVDRMRSQLDKMANQEKSLQEALKSMCTRKRDHLAASNMNPFDDKEEAAFDLKPAREHPLPIPWVQKDSFCDRDYNVLMELERLQSELSECRLPEKMTSEDIAYETNRERTQLNKFARLKELRKTPLDDRIKLVTQCQWHNLE